jgi:hypothetical protein
MKRSSRETFYDQHFLGAVGKIQLAVTAFFVDLILAQDTDVREHFLPYTVPQQAGALLAIATTLAEQLLVIQDEDRVQDARALHVLCGQFRQVLEHLIPPGERRTRRSSVRPEYEPSVTLSSDGRT